VTRLAAGRLGDQTAKGPPSSHRPVQ